MWAQVKNASLKSPKREVVYLLYTLIIHWYTILEHRIVGLVQNTGALKLNWVVYIWYTVWYTRKKPKYNSYTVVYIKCIHRFLRSKMGQSPNWNSSRFRQKWAPRGPKEWLAAEFDLDGPMPKFLDNFSIMTRFGPIRFGIWANGPSLMFLPLFCLFIYLLY